MHKYFPLQFESLVNTEGFQTAWHGIPVSGSFESLVNTEGFQTEQEKRIKELEFESLVNTEGFQTITKLGNKS